MSTAGRNDGFLAFYREYAHTGIHTITATALTAFGLLTFVHRGFVVLAIAVYVLPPVYLYLTRNGEAPEPVDGNDETRRTDAPNRPAASESAPGGTEDADSAVSVNDGDRRPDREEPATAGSGTATGSDRRDEGAPETASGTAAESAGGDDIAGAGGSEPADARDERSEPASAAGAASGSESGSAPPNPDTSGVSDADDGSEDEAASGDDLGGEDREDGAEPAEWVEADAPTDETLLDAVLAGQDAYAAGENGVLLTRSEDEEWKPALESGPAAESTTLRGVDITEDGEAVWVAGDGGVLGRYDPTTTRHTDHSAPEGITDNWSGLAVAGAAGEERVALVNGSGQVLFGEYDGSEVEWGEPIKPGSGSSMSAIEFLDESTGYCCDTNAGVYRIEGSEFERIGIENASGFDGLTATEDAVAVASDDGTLQRFDGSVWTPVRVSETALSGLDTDGEEWLAVGAGGAIHGSRESDWEAVDSPTEADLFAVAVGDPPVVVGAGGTVLERR